MQSAPGPLTVIDGREYLYFAGTGYLGLQGHSALISAACEALKRYGLGSATSRSGFGDTPPTLDVERAAAKFFGNETAFYFPSGFVGASIICRALAGSFDRIVIDEAAHYAISEAARSVGCPVTALKHRDAGHLRELLRTPIGTNRTLLMSDGVFAATGAIAPVRTYFDVLAEHGGGTIYLDDAHAAGVIGERGRGTYEYAGFDERWNQHLPGPVSSGESGVRLYSSATLSKAFGAFGGIATGSDQFIQLLKQSPYFNGATAPLPAAAAAATAMELIMADPGIRLQLSRNVAQLKARLAAIGLSVDDTPVPIVPIVLESAARMQGLQQALLNEGIAISYFSRYAGLGPEGALRIAVFASHSPAMIDTLAAALQKHL
jgi:glycine C-acetyltransferase/8-amino-7-oxononanoate synthase